MPKKENKPTQTWMTFLRNHVGQLVSIDFFTVATIRLRVLYVFIILSHNRRCVLHFNVTEHPTADWAAQQLLNRFLTTLHHVPGARSRRNLRSLLRCAS
jgi:putative transposase